MQSIRLSSLAGKQMGLVPFVANAQGRTFNLPGLSLSLPPMGMRVLASWRLSNRVFPWIALTSIAF